MSNRKKLKLTVEVEVDMCLPEWMQNPTAKDIEDIEACGFSCEDSEDLHLKAAQLLILGYGDSNSDVFGKFRPMWTLRIDGEGTKNCFGEVVSANIVDHEIEEAE